MSFLIFLIIKTISFTSQQINPDTIQSKELKNERVTVLQQAIKLQTISGIKDSITNNEFDSLHHLIKSKFPLVDKHLNQLKFNNHSVLWEWKGSDQTKKPILLMAHQDVVPVDSLDLEMWTNNPWEGEMIQDTIYGRGVLDDKGGLFAQLEAIEQLLEEGFTPQRTIYLASGHDEEIGGDEGAREIAEYCKSQNIHFSFVLDEGLYILEGIVPNLSKDVAFIGLAEKGYLSVELSCNVPGGHSSIPSKDNAIDIISKAINQLTENQVTAKLSIPTKAFLEFIGPEMPFKERVIFANSFLFKDLLISIYQKSSAGNAIVRTTTAPTIFQSGTKDNVVPSVAKAVVNFRILPSDTKESVMKHIQEVINDDRVQIATIEYNAPSDVSEYKNEAFKRIHKSIKQIFPEVLVSPNLMVGGSDSKHFEAVADNIYRFRPFRLNEQTINGIHGINERLAVNDYSKAISFYRQLIINSQN